MPRLLGYMLILDRKDNLLQQLDQLVVKRLDILPIFVIRVHKPVQDMKQTEFVIRILPINTARIASTPPLLTRSRYRSMSESLKYKASKEPSG